MSVIETEPLATLRSNSWTVWHRNIVEAVPRLARRKDATLPIIVALSILAHLAIIISMFLSQTRDTQPTPQDISVELVAPPMPVPPPAIKAPPPAPPPAAKAPDKKAQAKAEPKAQSKREAKAESTAQPKTQPKAEAKAQPKAPPKPAPKEAPKAASKPADTAKAPAPGDVARRMKALLGPTPEGLGNPADQDNGEKDLAGLAAVALSGESANGTDTVSFKRIVMSHIAKAKSEGTCAPVADGATVEFVLAPTGSLTRVALLRPSGNAALDTEAVALVKRAEPYPPPPPGGRSDYVFTLRCGTR